MKKFLKNIVKLKKISTIKDFGSGHFRQFPVRVRVRATLFTDHRQQTNIVYVSLKNKFTTQ